MTSNTTNLGAPSPLPEGGKSLRIRCIGTSLCHPLEPMEHQVEHEEHGAKGAFYVQRDGQRIAEMTYSRINATMIIIDHTEVDTSLSGQGIGRKLLDALVQWARATSTKVVALCPFAKAQFNKDPSIRDVLV